MYELFGQTMGKVVGHEKIKEKGLPNWAETSAERIPPHCEKSHEVARCHHVYI